MTGNLLAYGEWEALTILASHLGPAEVAAWYVPVVDNLIFGMLIHSFYNRAILGSLWDTFESTTEGIGEAAAVRIAFHMGRNDMKMARISTYKSSLLGMIFAFFMTAIFLICGDSIPVWLTDDATLQHLIAQLLPLMGIGNLSFTFGMLAWNQLGGQGRYKIATLIHCACSWLITLPLASIFVYVFEINLEGITCAVVVSYATAALIMAFMLLTSDWERLATIIQELNAIEDESSDDDSSSSSSRSSSSSSSSDSE